MQPLFKFYIDDELVEEPQGLAEAELNLVRDEALKGVFFTYTSELKIKGTGYAALKAIRDTGPGCAQPTARVDYRCAETGAFETLYEAIIPLGSQDVEWDDYNCTVTTKLENADFSNLLQRRGDTVIPLNNKKTANGSDSLATVSTNNTLFFTSFDGVLTTSSIKTYLFTDVLQQALSYISDNQITLVPDPLYSTLYLSQILELTFIDPLAPGDVITLEFTNYYGQTYTVTHVCTGVSDITAFARQTLHFADPAAQPDLDRDNFLEKASSASVVGSVVTITNFLPWDPNNITFEVNAGAKATSLIETQEFQYGLKNLAITNSTFLQEQRGTLIYTLNQLLNHASEMHNMGFHLERTTTGYNFNLTFMPDMLVNASSSVNLPQTPTMKVKTSGTYNVNSLTTAKGTADNIFKPFTWNSVNCYGENKKIEGQRFSSQEFFDELVSTQIQDDALFFVFLKEGDYSEVEGYRVIVSSTAFASMDQFHYNIPYVMALIAKQNQIYAANNDFYGDVPLNAVFDPDSTCAVCPDAIIANTNPIVLRNVVEFDYPLTYAQVRNLIDNPLQYLTFSDGRRVTKKGFIKEATIPFKNFLTSFELYTD